jgi:large subunit ribosomal protein L9
MASVKVILKQDVPSLGQSGEIKQVAPGYFRNFLLPRGLAVEATQSQIRTLEASSAVQSARATRAKGQQNALALRLEELLIRIPVRLGEQGRIYGSVTNKDISEALQEQASIAIDRHDIVEHEPLRSIGEHTVGVKVAPGVEANLRVELVEAETAAG